jgi:hypothetical protein
MKTHRSFNKLILSLFAALVAAAGSVTAQEPSATPPDDTGQVKTFEVRLPVTVTRKKDLVTGLKRGDFAIFEDGVQQEITFFSDEKTNPPVFVGVLMDTSPSTAGKLGFSKEAAKNFLYTVTRLRKDQGGLHDL